MSLSKSDRQSHLNLRSKCVMIGGMDSRHYRGLLAWYLGTTIPSGMKIYLCHACNNHKCSNPNHLYWGTAKENSDDARKSGNLKSIYEFSIAKYGKENYNKMMREAFQRGGRANRGKTKYSEEKKNEIRNKISDIDLSKRGALGLVAKRLDTTPQGAGKILKKINCRTISTMEQLRAGTERGRMEANAETAKFKCTLY